MKSSEYWRKREESWINQQIKEDLKQAKLIAEKYQKALDQIQKEINANWQNFSGKEGVSLSEAKKLADQMDVEAFARKAAQYVKDKDFSKTANDELRVYNLKMRVNRLELLKNQLGLELVALSDDMDKYTADLLTKVGLAEAERQAGILGETVFKNYKDAVNSIVNGSFQGANFSERIWGNIGALKADLDRLLIRGITQGKNPRDLARELRNLFGSSRYEAERLMRTETARVQVSVQLESYKKYGIEEFEYIAEPSACDTCKPLNGKVFKVDKMVVALNAPPMHPNCRCSTAPYVEREFDTDWTNYLSGVDGKVSDSINSAHSAVLSHGKRTGNELMKLIDRNTGKHLLSEAGGEDFVDFSSEIIKVLEASKANSIILTHNHPSLYNTPFSRADIKQLIKYDSIDLLTLVTENADQYLIQKGSEKMSFWKKVSYDQSYNKILQKNINKYGEKDELWSKIVDETNREIAKKYGLKYGKVDD